MTLTDQTVVDIESSHIQDQHKTDPECEKTLYLQQSDLLVSIKSVTCISKL
jgi:hypothetical protein